jgi:hypothetical protein
LPAFTSLRDSCPDGSVSLMDNADFLFHGMNGVLKVNGKSHRTAGNRFVFR